MWLAGSARREPRRWIPAGFQGGCEGRGWTGVPPRKAMNAIFFLLAALALVLVPLAPQLVRIRIRIFRWIGWDWGVRVLEKHFDTWVRFVRILLVVIAAVLAYLGWTELGD